MADYGKNQVGYEFPTQTLAGTRIMKNIPNDLPAYLTMLPVACLILNEDGVIEQANPAADRLFGFENGRFPQRPFSDFLPTGHRATLTALLQKTAISDVPTSHELQVITANGRFVWYRAEAVSTADQAGCCLVLTDIDSYKQAESHYQMLVEQNPAIIYLDQADEIGSNNYMSPQIEKLLGYSPATYQEDPSLWHEQVFADDYDAASAGILEVLRTGEAIVEYRMIHKDGRIVWVRDSAVLVRDEQGEPAFIQGFLEDITKTKVAENKLRETQTLLSSLLEHAPVSIFVDTVDGRLQLANKQWAEDVKIGREDAIGRSLKELYPPELAERYLRENEEVIKKAYIVKEAWADTSHGPRCFYTVKFAIPGADGEITAVGGVALDVTARKQLEEELRRLANRLTTTLESITDAFFTLDRGWRFTYINQEAERILERTRGELIGKAIWEEFAPAIGTAFELEFRRAIRENRAVTFEEFYPPLKRWFEVNAYPSEEGLAVYFRDITQRKQSQTQLQQQLDELRRWYRATLGREMRILDLKQEINALLAQVGQPPRYQSAEPLKEADNEPESG